jgi:anti-sigma B factor antagonist
VEHSSIGSFSVEPAWTVSVAGEIDVSNADELDAMLDRPGWIIVDASGLSFIDSSGLRALVKAQNRLVEQGSGLVVVGLREGPRRVIEVTGLERLLGG